jgi:hypothetical protein
MLLRHLSLPGPGRNRERTGRRIVGGFASLPAFQEPSGQLASPLLAHTTSLGGYDGSRLYHHGIFFDSGPLGRIKDLKQAIRVFQEQKGGANLGREPQQHGISPLALF